MGRRRNPPAKWVLPDIVNPADSTCFTITVPNNRLHRAAFFGALYNLTSARFWQDDMAHTAKEVAAVWQTIFDSITEQPCNQTCPAPIDDEVDMSSLCELLRWNNGVLQALCCGTWTDIPGFAGAVGQQVGQPGPGGSGPIPGDCQEFDVLLDGNGQWHCPIPVGANSQIIISNVQGAWHDGSIHWYCPDGEYFALGNCSGGQATNGADPLPSVFHARLVAAVGGVYYDAYNQTIQLGGGQASADLIFQMNDNTLSDNHGSIRFHLKICNKNLATWTHDFNFSGGQHGWFITNSANGTLTWNPGGYWHSANTLGHVGDGSGIVAAPVVGEYQVTQVVTHYGANNTSTVRNIVYSHGGAVIQTVPMTNAAGADVVTTDTRLLTVDEISVQLGADAIGKNCDLARVIISGLGTDPFVGY